MTPRLALMATVWGLSDFGGIRGSPPTSETMWVEPRASNLMGFNEVPHI